MNFMIFKLFQEYTYYFRVTMLMINKRKRECNRWKRWSMLYWPKYWINQLEQDVSLFYYQYHWSDIDSDYNIVYLWIVNTLCLGKPEKGKMVEEMLLNMAQRGQLPGKLGEKELINLLENVNQQTQKKTIVKVNIIVIISTSNNV